MLTERTAYRINKKGIGGGLNDMANLITSGICAMGALTIMAAASVGQVDDNAIITRSLLSKGDSTRIARVMLRAKRGEPITVSVIGGSITAGAKASTDANRYGNRIAAWWRERFPKSKITFVNAGIGATGSSYGALRARRDLLCHNPDFVVVEYGVNDPNDQAAAETLEGLIRQILKLPNKPAAMLMFMMNNVGGNAQEWHSKVGAYYNLPMASYRDALWPDMVAKKMEQKYVFADEVHPNDLGHEYVARFAENILSAVYSSLPQYLRVPAIKPLPKPLFTDLYEYTGLLAAKDLLPSSNKGWALDPTGAYWAATDPGSVMEFDISGRLINLVTYRLRGAMGRAKIQVDDKPAVTLDAWFDGTWGGYTPTDIIGKDLTAGKHHVRIELLNEKADLSTGHEFRIYNVGTAGVK